MIEGCSDYYMKFKEESFKLSGRTMDLGATNNWTISTWPAGMDNGFTSDDESIPPSFRWTSKYNAIGISGNWFGDSRKLFPSLFGDGLNDQGLSCGMLTLVDSKYEDLDVNKKNIFFGTFCQYAVQMYASVTEAAEAMDSITIYGPDILQEHFILRDATGASLVIEMVDGKKNLYLDLNDDGETGFGIMTNEPELSYHLTNVEHYTWKRSLARQAVAVPGGWYPEERFLRIHMVKSGMEESGDADTTDFQQAFSLTTQVLNTVTVPMGFQYGTDTGENSGEGGNADHTMWGVIRDHHEPSIYWRDSYNPTFRRLRLKDIDFKSGEQLMIVLECGPYYIDMLDKMVPLSD